MTEHTHHLDVRYADTDAQGVVFFANYLTYMDEATAGWLAAVGLPYAELLGLGVDFVYADAHVSYKGSARYGDTVAVQCRAARVGNTSFVTAHTLRVGGQIIAEGELVHVCIGPDRTPVPVPDALREAVR